jgi:Concanavalin A-like lectin/glucanases superfamily
LRSGGVEALERRADDGGAVDTWWAGDRHPRRSPSRRSGVVLALLAFGCLSSRLAYARTCTWSRAGSAGTFVTAANWTCSSGSGPPASADDAIFDGTSSQNCTIGASISVTSLQINSGYTGTVTQGSGITIMTAGALSKAGTGTFTGDSGATSSITVGGNFALSAGTFTSTAGRLEVAGTFSQTGGTFAPSSGTVALSSTSSRTLAAGTFGALRIEDFTENNLVGYWKADAGQGTSVRDYSGNGHTGSLVSAPTWVTSGLTTAIDFQNLAALHFRGAGSGLNDYADLGATATNTASAFSACAWARFTALTGNHTVVAIDGTNISGFFLKRDSSAPFSFQMHSADNTSGTLYYATGTTTPTTATWYHLCGTFDGTNARLYVNGALEATSATVAATWTAAGHTMIGSGLWSAARTDFVNGDIDDVRIYNTALTAAQVSELAAGRYANTGGTSTWTLGANTTVSGVLAVDSGGLATGSYTMNASSASTVAEVYTGSYTVGSATSTFAGGLAVQPPGTLTLATSGGAVAIGSATSLIVDGTLNASSAGATIRSVSGNYAFKVGSVASAMPTLNVSGLAVQNTDTNGMQINANTSAVTTFTGFDNIAFSSGTGTRLLQIYGKTLYLTSNGCTFDAGTTTATTTYAVTLAGNGYTGSPDTTETRAIFGGTTCANNWTVGSSDRSCLTVAQGTGISAKSDDDSDGNGVGNTPASNGAVVQFTRAADSDTAGSVVGFPTAAFDWNTFTYYSIYVAFHDASGTSDVVYVRDETGTPLYSWTVPTAGETIIGTPRWNTVSSKHYLYVATTAGHVYRLVDNGTSSLALDASGAWATNPYNCSCTITTPLGMDTSNLYWGGTASGQKLWTLGQAAESTPTGSPFSMTPTITGASPALWTSGSAYLFLGLTGHVLKINVSNQTLTADNTSPGSASVWGRISVGTNQSSTTRVYAGDDGGTMWAIDPNNFTSTNKLWSYHTANAIMGSSYYDHSTDTIQYGTQGGTVIVLNGSGAVLNAGYPYTPGAVGDAITAAPLYYSGVLAVGSTGGKLYFIDRNNGASSAALIREYYFGPTESVSGVGFDSNVNRYMVTTANSSTNDGRLYYIDLIADPTPGSS